MIGITIWTLVSLMGSSQGWLFYSGITDEPTPTRVCYDQLGCFDDEPPFDFAGGLLPASPEEIGVALYHYSPDVTWPGNFIWSPLPWPDFPLPDFYNRSQPVVVVIHGYKEDTRSPHQRDLFSELAIQGSVNVVAVDWGEGAHALYAKSVANARVVAAVVSLFLRRVLDEGNIGPDSVHLIGYSLGAHIAGYIGKSIPGIARITGLDPAEFLFMDTPADVRLDRSDATFVDIIHTNGAPIYQLAFGMIEPMGDVDFYPNGGKHQPGCSDTLDRLLSLVTGSQEDITCSHRRSVELFTESINSPCGFLSTSCLYDHIMNGYCVPCRGVGCVSMGYHVNATLQGTFYLVTNDFGPFCLG